VNSQEKPITVEEIFLEKMLETNYNLNLRQLLKITPRLKRHLRQKLKLEKIQNLSRATT
jgi:hypothetical protein